MAGAVRVSSSLPVPPLMATTRRTDCPSITGGRGGQRGDGRAQEGRWRFPLTNPGDVSTLATQTIAVMATADGPGTGPPQQQKGGKSSTVGSAGGMADFVAGALGGVAVCCITQPLDTVKVLLQSQPGRFTSAWQCIRAVMHQSVSVGRARGPGEG